MIICLWAIAWKAQWDGAEGSVQKEQPFAPRGPTSTTSQILRLYDGPISFAVSLSPKGNQHEDDMGAGEPPR